MAAERRSDLTGVGVGVWSSGSWLAEAVGWLDAQLAAAGIERTGAVEQPRVRPWSTLLRAPTSAGYVWFKAAAPRTAFEVPLYEVLARVVPDQVLQPIGADAARGWIVLPDGGAPLTEVAGLPRALADYARLQRTVESHVDELLAAGVPDMRPAAMAGRFDEALAVVAAEADTPEDRDVVGQIAAMRPTVEEWCEELAASPLPPSLDHNDLHPFNVLGSAPPFRYYDWGDSVIAHPFAVMLVPLGMLGGEARIAPARDAYLAAFSDHGTRDELGPTLELACRVAKIARALTWERALAAARDQGEAVPEQFAKAPLETLASILDPSYFSSG